MHLFARFVSVYQHWLLLPVSNTILAFGIIILPRKAVIGPTLKNLVMGIKNRFLVQNLVRSFAVKFLAER